MPFTLLDRLLAPAPARERVAWLGSCEYAHRGLHAPGRPENSLPAFRAAIDAGMGIECDVQKSGDGQAMVFHDWDLDRLTGETGPVAAHPAQDLAAIPLLDDGGTIPPLRALLDLVAGRVPLLIEVKSKREKQPAPLCLAVRNALEGYRGPVAVMSFDPRVPKWFKRHAPHILRGLVFTEEDERGLAGALKRNFSLWHAAPDFLAYDIRDLPSAFPASQRARGLPLLTWTVRSAELRERVARLADAPIAEGKGVAAAAASE